MRRGGGAGVGVGGGGGGGGGEAIPVFFVLVCRHSLLVSQINFRFTPFHPCQRGCSAGMIPSDCSGLKQV